MIPLNTYVAYFKNIPSILTGIKECIVVTRESDLAFRIKQIAGDKFPVLVVVIPSADSIAMDPDNIKESNTCLLYVLQMFDPKDRDEDNFLSMMDSIQAILQALKLQMLADKGLHEYHHWLHDLDMNAMHTDPEYDYLGCNGWSLSFNLITQGF